MLLFRTRIRRQLRRIPSGRRVVEVARHLPVWPETQDAGAPVPGAAGDRLPNTVVSEERVRPVTRPGVHVVLLSVVSIGA